MTALEAKWPELPFDAWLKGLGFEFDPFSSIRAEDYLQLENGIDLLNEHFVQHPGYFEQLLSSHSMVIVAPSGAGKTANRMMLERRLWQQPKSYVISYDSFSMFARSLDHNGHDLQALRSFEFSGYPFWRRLHDSAQWRGFEAVYVLMDGMDGQQGERLEKLVKGLLDQGSAFGLSGLHFKLFLSEDFKPRIEGTAAYQSGLLEIRDIRWPTQQLKELLQKRLVSANPAHGASLDRIFQTSHYSWDEALPNLAAKTWANKGSPAALLHAAQIFLEEVYHSSLQAGGSIHSLDGEALWQRVQHRLQEGEGTPYPIAPIQRAKPMSPLVQVELIQRSEDEIRVTWKLPEGDVSEICKLPYSSQQLALILKAIEKDLIGRELTQEETDGLGVLALMDGVHLHPNHRKDIGRQLFQTLNHGKIRLPLGTPGEPVHLQLRFFPEDVEPTKFPWELLHDGYSELLPSGRIELTRCITYGERPNSLTADLPLRVLYVAPRPADLDDLPTEWEALQEGVSGLNGQVIAEDLRQRLRTRRSTTPLTAEATERRLEALDQPVHLIHFDGHGAFGRRCPDRSCGKMHGVNAEKCVRCGRSLATVDPQGYLAFEHQNGESDYVNAREFGISLGGSGVRLVMLSACRTAVVQGWSLFDGVAPSLILAGVPAVVAMQFKIRQEEARSFVRAFYAELAQSGSIIQAMNKGRKRLYRSGTFFVPALYLRSTDLTGLLFKWQG